METDDMKKKNVVQRIPYTKMNQMRWQRRGLEHKCLPLTLIIATTPAVTPAHKADARYCCVFLPAVVLYIIQNIKSHNSNPPI